MADMKSRTFRLVLAAALLLVGPLAQTSAAAPGLDETTPTLQAACSDEWTCLELAPVTLTPPIEVAGVQTSADDARQAGEADPFIINDGFGD